MAVAEIGIIGGSGLYEFPGLTRELTVQTPYGPTSGLINVGAISGRNCAFLSRHGHRHHLPPHRVPYRANIYALKELGVTQIIGITAAGALNDRFKVGSFVCPDQLVDFTRDRGESTFYDGPITTHIGFTEPYCPAMRGAAAQAFTELGISTADHATVVVTPGPRFSTRAESEFFCKQGWDLENMTQYPEAVLARELTLSYMNLSLVTNSHVPAREKLAGELANAPEVLDELRQSADKLVSIIELIVSKLPKEQDRPGFIKDALSQARFL